MANRMMRFLRPVGCALVLAGCMTSADVAHAEGGLFGFLGGFGQPYQRPEPTRVYPQSYPSRPLEMRVGPRRVMKPSTSPGRFVARPRRPQMAGRDVQMTQKETYAKLSPATNPQWYLQDPTLRHGDLIVGEKGVMVFVGEKNASHGKTDFQPIAQASDISKAERQQLDQVATLKAN
jgi:hypothetical protein